MKKNFSLLLLCLIISKSIFSQKDVNQGVLTLGIGRGIAPISYNVMYDYGLSKHFSLGLAINNGKFRSIIPAPVGLLPAPINYSNLYRTNVGVRALFHVGNSTNWDPYLGFRGGVSIWSGEGKFVYHGLSVADTLFSAESEDIYPSVQAVLGVRYLFSDWLGVNAELALGSPYAYSVGINCKLTNTKAGAKSLKNDYLGYASIGDSTSQSFLQPVEKKNILKVALQSIFLTPGLSYERHIANRFALEIGGSYNFGAIFTVAENTEVGVFSETDSISTKMQAYGMLKYYITARKNAIPKGWYIGLTGNYTSKTTSVQVIDLDSVPSPISFDYEKKQTKIAGGLVLGYQYTFKKHFCLDAFAGYCVGPTRLDYMKYYSADASEEKFISRFGSHLTQVNGALNSAIFRVSVGYVF